MHEIINITQNDGELIFSVKGIQNLLGDPNVSPSQILGKVTFKSSLLTYVYALATHTHSAFIIIMILVINVFIVFQTHAPSTCRPGQRRLFPDVLLYFHWQ